MLNNCKVIALVPARGGSKGLRGKNIKNLNGIPLIKYTLGAACRSKFIDDVFVSSDDDQILDVANVPGVTTIKRSDYASSDIATATDVLHDFFRNFDGKLDLNTYIIYLQPTSPFRNEIHIDDAFKQLSASDGTKLVSVYKIKQNILKSYQLDLGGMLIPLFGEEYTNSNRQSLPETYYPNGAIYIFQYKDFIENQKFPTNGSLPFLMNEQDSIDIDTEYDFKRAEEKCHQK